MGYKRIERQILRRTLRVCGGILTSGLLLACSGGTIHMDREVAECPGIFPDYAGVTIPPNIAPLNFALTRACEGAVAHFSAKDEAFEVRSSDGALVIPAGRWEHLLKVAAGDSIRVKIGLKREGRWTGYAPFSVYVAPEPVDGYLAYRLIEPGYELWNRMGIYQRDLTGFDESPIMENKSTGDNCMNCHSFCMQDPDRMLFHMRGKYAATLLIDGDKVEKLNTKTPQTLSPLVYPSWHPSGRYVAFSVNQTKQSFHMNDRNRVEVFDAASDVVVYDQVNHEIVTIPILASKEAFETFPTFSPDGRTLYFCTAEARPMPKEYDQVKYHLCSIAFDPEKRSFGTKVDTLYQAGRGGKSASFPRVSPDGRFLLFTLSGYGNFSIWHKDADLYLADLATKECRALEAVNSPDVESYHSWSSNSRWIVFSSRRLDGLYTRPFIAYVDSEGQASKPFLLPQADPRFYHALMKSYNIPEFVAGKVKDRRWQLSRLAKEAPGVDVKFVPESGR